MVAEKHYNGMSFEIFFEIITAARKGERKHKLLGWNFFSGCPFLFSFFFSLDEGNIFCFSGNTKRSREVKIKTTTN